MKIFIIGAGRWGSLITYYLDTLKHDVTLYGPADTEHMKQFLATRRNSLLTLPESVKLSTDINDAKYTSIRAWKIQQGVVDAAAAPATVAEPAPVAAPQANVATFDAAAGVDETTDLPF